MPARRALLAAALICASLAGCAAPPPPAALTPPPPTAAPQPAAPHPIEALAARATATREMALNAPDLPRFAPLAEHPFTPPARGKAILVNIPSYELIAYEDGLPALRSRVIVGKRRTPTPIMDVATAKVRFRPSWRPTPSMIAKGEYPDKVTPPGRRNPLGLAAIRFDNGSRVYLHGTSRPHLFKRDRRAYSHGCIRVERLEELVGWLLDWPADRVRNAMRRGRTRDIATDAVPVMVRYYLDLPDAEGRAATHRDVYRRGRNVVASDL